MGFQTPGYSNEFCSYCRHSFVKATQFSFIRHGVHNDRKRSEKVFINGFLLCFKKCWRTKTHHGNSAFGVRVNGRQKQNCHQLINLSSRQMHASTNHVTWNTMWQKTKQTSRDGLKQPKILLYRAWPFITCCSHQLTINQKYNETEYSEDRNVPENSVNSAGVLVIPLDYKLTP